MLKYSIMLMFIAGLLQACGSAYNADDEIGTGNDNDKVDTLTINDSYTYELPVIFHVLYANSSNSSQYIPYQRLDNLLQYVNEIYKGGVYGESENINIKFVLATTDENGKKLAHPGVDYVEYTGEYPIDEDKFMMDQTGENVKYIWEPSKYINVMMFNFKNTNNSGVTLGISHMPFSIKGDNELKGLETVTSPNINKSNLRFAYCSAINSLYANTSPNGGYYQSDRYTNSNHNMTTYTSADVVMTLAHELGHYLGLYHVFTERHDASSDGGVLPVDSCADTDYCEDTYSYNRHEYIEYLEYEGKNETYINPLLKRHSCEGTEYEADNIMDYSVGLGFKITPQQKQRIRHVLYYSPLIPGPKKYRTTRAATVNGLVDIKPITIK